MANARISLRVLILCALILATQIAAPAEMGLETGGIDAWTAPSKDVTLSFTQPGRIASLKVKEGDSVQAGQQVAQLDDSIELAQLAQLEAQSSDTTQIEAREAELSQKQVDLAKFERAAAQNAVSPLEIEHARLDAKIAELAVRIAKFQHKHDQRKYEEAKIRVEMMKLKSPIAGRVEKINSREGEAVDTAEDVVRVVETNPLWVDVPVPLATAQRLAVGQTARVTFPAGAGSSAEGKIIFVAGVAADPASGTLTVRLEVPNESRRPAGEKVSVAFSQTGAAGTGAGQL
jgi:RND family efflux transporter MFP subunit